MNSNVSEEVFREALGLKPAEKKQRISPKNSPVRFTSSSTSKANTESKLVKPKIVLVYNVRKKDGGPAFHYEFESNSISVFETELLAKKDMDSKCLVPWVLLERKIFN